MRKSVLLALSVTVGMGGGSFAATINGKTLFKGKTPTSGKILMNADPKCLEAHKGQAVYAEEVVVGKGGSLANVFVYVKQGLEGKSFATPKDQVVVFDQKGCWYAPHVFGIQVGQTLRILNSDPTMHNVNAKALKAGSFNAAMPAGIKPLEKKFNKPEIMVKIKCNVHPWMSAYAGVLEHPFFGVTGREGKFDLKNLPAGKYTVEAWHEKYGAVAREVAVGDKETKTVEFVFSR